MKRILVVEDDPVIRGMLADILAAEGCQVLTAENGREGLDKAKADPPDLILADVLMPVMDGFTLAEELSRTPGLDLTPLIFLTAKGERSDVRRGMTLGAVDYLSKPVSTKELIEAVRTALRKGEVIDKQVGDLLRNVTNRILPYEFRTPLNAVMGLSSLIRDFDPPREDVIAYAEEIYNAGRALLIFVDKMTLYAALAAGAFADHERPCDARTLGEQVGRHAKAFAPAESLLFDLPETPLPHCSEGLFIVVRELVDAALTRRSPGTVVRIDGEARDSGFVVSVHFSSMRTSEADLGLLEDVSAETDGLERLGVGLASAALLTRRRGDLLGGRREGPTDFVFELTILDHPRKRQA